MYFRAFFYVIPIFLNFRHDWEELINCIFHHEKLSCLFRIWYHRRRSFHDGAAQTHDSDLLYTHTQNKHHFWIVFILTAMGSLDGVSYALEYSSKKKEDTINVHVVRGTLQELFEKL